jgi:SAM-dependent methyltransferase
VFDKSAKVYDLIYKGKNYEEEASFLDSLIKTYRPRAGSVLDLGCGTGEHGLHLAKHFQYAVTGIDINAEMIGIAQNKGQDATFIHGDMTDFSLGKKYDVIISMFSAIGWLKSLDHVARAFSCASDHLNQDGLIIVEPWLFPENFSGGHIFMDVEQNPDLKICRISRTDKISDIHNDVSKIEFHYTVGTLEKVETYTEMHEIGLYKKEDIIQNLRNVGIESDYVEFPGKLSKRGLFIGKKVEPSPIL